MKVFVGIKSEGEDIGELVQRLLGIEGVGEAYELSGTLDIMLRVDSGSASGVSSIMERIKATPGVKAATSHLVIGERR